MKDDIFYQVMLQYGIWRLAIIKKRYTYGKNAKENIIIRTICRLSIEKVIRKRMTYYTLNGRVLQVIPGFRKSMLSLKHMSNM